MTPYERRIYRRVIVALLVAAAVVWYAAPAIDGKPTTVRKVSV